MGATMSTPQAPDPKSGMCALTNDEVMIVGAWDKDINFTTKDAQMPDARTRKSGYLDRTSALAASANMPEFVSKLPKAELHVHIEGCLTPERCYQIVVRNGQSHSAALLLMLLVLLLPTYVALLMPLLSQAWTRKSSTPRRRRDAASAGRGFMATTSR